MTGFEPRTSGVGSDRSINVNNNPLAIQCSRDFNSAVRGLNPCRVWTNICNLFKEALS